MYAWSLIQKYEVIPNANIWSAKKLSESPKNHLVAIKLAMKVNILWCSFDETWVSKWKFCHIISTLTDKSSAPSCAVLFSFYIRRQFALTYWVGYCELSKAFISMLLSFSLFHTQKCDIKVADTLKPKFKSRCLHFPSLEVSWWVLT